MTALTLEITSVAHDGRGIGFMPGGEGRGKAVFVPGALPGQTVACSLIRENRAWAEGRLVEVVADAEMRRAADCPHAAACGGCAWRSMEYSQQLGWKSRLALEAMSRIGGLDRERLNSVVSPIQASPLLNEYRNKLQLAFGPDDAGMLALGFRKRASHSVVALENCPAAEAGALNIISRIATLTRQSGLAPWDGKSGFLRFLILRHGHAHGRLAWHALCVTSRGSKEERRKTRRLAEQALRDCADLAAFVHEESGLGSMRAIGQNRVFALSSAGAGANDAGNLELGLGGRYFQLDVASFFQVNTQSAEILANLAREMDGQCASHQMLLDLCCGVGAPGLLLARRYQATHGIETDRRAVQAYRINARGLATCAQADVAKFRPQARKWGTILADPPRQGLGAAAIQNLLAAAPGNIIYISCNPATLARDSALLNSRYRLDRFAMVDLFPHTPHVECCTLWTSKAQAAE